MNSRRIVMPIVAVTAMFMQACGETKEAGSETTTPVEEQKTEVCTYTADQENVEILWTAYKYNQKTGVKGKFAAFSISGSQTTQGEEGVLEGVIVDIMTESLDSGDPIRDPKILEHFFGSFEGGDKIHAEVLAVDGESSNLNVAITMNGKTVETNAPYTIENGQIEVKMELSVNDWAAEAGLAALHAACEDVHKGSDGESILWPDVSIIVMVPVTIACD